MRVSSRTIATLAVALLLVTAGCAASSGGNEDGGYLSGQSTQVSSGGDGGAATDAAAEGETANVDGDAQFAQRREIIRTGEMRVEVDDVETARDNLTAAVEARGGYVSDTSVENRGDGNQTWSNGRIVLRVPQENYSALLEDAREEGTVEFEQTGTQDVTGQVVDLEARLENLRAERDRLRELYQQANETEDVLAVQRELSDVQSEIERIEAQLQTLEQRVAFSTLTVHLEEPRPEGLYDRASWYDTGVLAAFLESVSGVGVTLRALVVGFAYAAPYLLVFGVPLVGAVILLRRRFGGIRSLRN
ncbi:hypothetical protein AUR64_10770 [Haloprofundus marisrubri]|uniref:DUF4349 domain-containing protein n=1 Tax=Haloprofundus marisrubri TaxID=1514971 RepID=A0A0W1R9R3_9EURY|nr:DUF4349 domain-containing protein [Haloprofundus marisrubri]KTG10074.1 hypothetical protein AUR64_10770 [Haloprofundus marisrubri]